MTPTATVTLTATQARDWLEKISPTELRAALMCIWVQDPVTFVRAVQSAVEGNRPKRPKRGEPR